MVFNATFNNIAAISWWSVFFGGGNQSARRKPLTCQILSHNVHGLNRIRTDNFSDGRH